VQLLEKVAALPGVQSAGAVTSLPLSPVGIDFDLPVVVQGRPRPRAGQEPQADFRVVSTDYFRTMKIPILQGREFTEFDGPATASVVIINETMQRQVFSGEDPIGQRLLLYGRPREIIGVVGSVRHHGFSRDTRPEMILPYRQFQLGGLTLVVRSDLETSGLTAAIKKEVHSIDPQLPFSRVRMMDELLAESVAQPRFTTLLLTGFASLAVTLALVGVYGVMSYSVSHRTKEIGVRIALGAVRSAVVWMVVRHGMSLVATGIIVGLGGAAVGTRLMARLLFGVTATDSTTFIAAAAALGVASLAATYIPALRAARVAPVTSLRSE
jgi:putative ABC transport system permease protein